MLRLPSRLIAPLSALPRALRWALGLLLAFALLWGLALPLAAEPLLRWAIGRLEPQLGGHRLDFAQARLSPWRLAVELDQLRLLPPQGEALAELGRLELNVDLLGSIRHRAFSLDLLRLDAPRLRLSLLPKGTNWTPLLQALQGEPRPKGADEAPPRLRVSLLQLQQGRFDYRDASHQPVRATYADALQLELSELSTLPEERGAHQLVARTALGAQLRWRGEFGLQPLQAEGELRGEGLELAKLWALLPHAPLAIQAPGGKAGFALRYAVRDEAGQPLSLKLDGLQLQLDELALQGLQASEPALRLRSLRLDGGSLDLQQRRLQLGRLALQGGRLLVARDAQGRVDLQDWLPPTTPSSEAAPPAPGPRWQLGLQAFALSELALRVDEAGFARPQRLELDELALSLGLQAELGGTADTALQLRDLRLQAEGLRAGDWLHLARVGLEGGELDLGARRLALGPISLQELELALQREADGSLPLLAALQPRQASRSGGPAQPEAAWTTSIGPLSLEGGGISLDDAAAQPRTRWRLQALKARLEGLGGASLRAEAAAALASGGRLSARGQLQPRLDLQLQLDALALPALQPLLAAYTPLRLSSGRFDAGGRLRLAQAWSFDGRARLGALRLDEAGGPLVQLRRLDAPRLRLSPALLDLGRLEAEGLQTKLLFDKQRQLNWAGLWKTPVDPRPAAASSAPAAPPPRVRMERLRLREVGLDFADLSLLLPFAARIHGGEGEFVGLDTAPGSPAAQLRFEGQVDEFGAASASGSLQPLAPTAFSDVRVQFRNVEMVSLTPYTATFAGRRIASGKLDLDLEYQLRDRQLQGDNRVIMQSLTLGEKVDSPDASSLPLDLAIALLEDSEGRIDLGLPVSGSLDDPKFSYGGLVWKVIVNVLTKVVTSPFRALGALLGGDQELADAIGFAPGSARLAPPEREKLKRLAEALGKRPGLALKLSAGFDASRDGEALKAAQLRRALGMADEDERLLNVEEERTREALLRLARSRLGEAAVSKLQQRHALAQPATPPGLGQRLLGGLQGLVGAAPVPLSDAERNELQGKPLGALLWQRLLAAEALAPGALESLGRARAEAAAAELAARGLPAARLRREAPAPLENSPREGGLQLPLGAEPLRISPASAG